MSYTYVDDRLTTITTPSGTVYTFLYDVHGRTSSVTINKVGSTAEPRTLATYTYNSSLTDYNGSPDGIAQMTYGNGHVTETEYDATSGLVTEDGKLSYDYIAGTLHSTGDAGDKPTDTYYHYDLAGRLISVARFESAPTSNTVFSLAYRYRDGSGLLDYTSFSDENFHLKSSWRYGNIDLGEVPDVVYDVLFNDALAVSYTYDGFYRRNTRTLHVGDGITTTYRFMNGAGENTTTTVVESVSEGGFTTSYTYDANGNILSITRVNDATNEVVDTKVYRYDGKNQLVFEGTSETVGTTYTYDNNGNILSKTDANGTVTHYAYTDPTWGDLLTSFNSEAISYDAIGNPLNWRGGATLTWKDGRKLSTYTKNGATHTYLYDGEGYRVGKTVGNTTYEYTVVDGIIYAETRTTGSTVTTLHYLFDDSGLRVGFVLNGTTTYYYRFNLQGDVTGIYDTNGNLIAEYTYDAWGAPVSVTGSDLTIANLNPIRYRGYYYDNETGLYHLMSRYYDPAVGRFISADALLSTGQGVLGYNMFAYCMNNPVNYADPKGYIGEQIAVIAVTIAVTVLFHLGLFKPDDELAYLAAITYAEAGGTDSRSRKAVAHSIVNRIELGHFYSPTTIKEVISYPGQYIAYNNPRYNSALGFYLEGKVVNNPVEKKAVVNTLIDVIPIFYGLEKDFTGGVEYFHNLEKPEDWRWHNSFTLVSVPGTDAFWYYIDEGR